MRKCKICDKSATDVVTSYNYTSWMCDTHVDTFILFATHWEYMKYTAVSYNPYEETETEKLMLPKLSDITKPITLPEVDPYKYAMYNPEARGFARPRGKHLKVAPRWYGMTDGTDGDVRVSKKKNDNVKVPQGVNTNEVRVPQGVTPLFKDKDPANKNPAGIWNPSIIYTKV